MLSPFTIFAFISVVVTLLINLLPGATTIIKVSGQSSTSIVTNTTSLTTTDTTITNFTATTASSNESTTTSLSTTTTTTTSTSAITTVAPTTTATTTTPAPTPSPPVEPPHFSSVDMLILPQSTTGAEVRAGTSLIHILLRGASWSAPVGSYIALSPLHLADGALPIVTPQQKWPRPFWYYLDPAYNVSSFAAPPVSGVPFAWWDLTPQNQNGSFTPGTRWNSSISGYISTWAEPVNQEDEILDATVQTGLLTGELKCYIKIVSVAEGLLLCNGTIYPSGDEQMFFVIPPFLISSLDVNASLYKDNEPQNTPYTVTVFITPESSLIRTIRQYITGILGLVTLVSTIVGKEPHIHIMSIARMSLIGRVLECSDEVDLLLSPTQIPLGRGIEKGRYFGALIFNTAIAMGLLIGHNVIARIFPRLLPDPPPSLQFVIAGALLPGITLAGIKTMTLQSSPVQFFLAIVVLILFIGAWFGCYWVTARDKNFFHRYGRWQHKTDPFFMIRWRVFFTSYKAKRRFYVLIEIVVTLLMAIPSGVTLSDYLNKDQSCSLRAVVMICIVGLDTLLVLVLRPYAIKIDKVVYVASKFFELAISAAAVARAGTLKYALEIGTGIWIASTLAIGVWQSYRAYDKAQYNSQQNEFFLTTADTDDVVFNELGGGGGGGGGRRRRGGDEDDDDDDEQNGTSSNNNGLGQKKKSTLQSLFPNSDYAAHPRDDDDDDDDEYSGTDNLLFRPNGSPREKLKAAPPPSSTTRERRSTQPPSSATAISNNNNNTDPSPWKGRLPPRNTGSAATTSNDDENKIQKQQQLQRQQREEEKDELEMALLSSNAPRLQFAHRGDSDQQSLSIPPSVGSISLPDDPLVEFWDALSDSSAYKKLQYDNNLKRRRSKNDGISNNNGDDIDDDDEEMMFYNNKSNNNNNSAPKTSSSIAEVHGTQANVNFAPKLAVREVSKKRKIPEAQPCRFQESLEAPADLKISDDDDDDDLRGGEVGGSSKRKQRAATTTLISGSGPNAVRKTNSLKKLESGEYAAKFADLFGEDVMSSAPSQSVSVGAGGAGRTASLPPKFVSDEFKQRFGTSGKVAADGVGIEL